MFAGAICNSTYISIPIGPTSSNIVKMLYKCFVLTGIQELYLGLYKVIGPSKLKWRSRLLQYVHLVHSLLNLCQLNQEIVGQYKNLVKLLFHLNNYYILGLRTCIRYCLLVFTIWCRIQSCQCKNIRIITYQLYSDFYCRSSMDNKLSKSTDPVFISSVSIS